MKLLLITSCTGEKQHDPAGQLTKDDFLKLHEPERFRASEERLSKYRLRAEDMYTGQQHVRLMRGVKEVRERLRAESVDLWIVSAGYGVISGDREIVPYECTFQGMKRKELREWAEHLKVPREMRKLLAQPYDLGMVLLGDSYLAACQLDEKMGFGGPTLFFCGASVARKFPAIRGSRTVVLTNREAKRFSCGLVGLKGEIGKRLLSKISREPELVKRIIRPEMDLLAELDGHVTTKTTRSGHGRVNPRVDRVITIPESWWNKTHRKKLQYFIPEWDDLVDPDYDFINDNHSGGSGDWSNEVYAHQLYPEPNYDGILMSRAVAQKSKKKKERITALGVHRYLRVPREFPIMGDCGAFDYIMQETPPYTTEDVIDYYTRLGFDYGVSVDHLIVRATENQKNFRYELTIHNAEEFLKEHSNAKLKWKPIGAVQGWDALSYAKAAAQYAKMGYKYIGLGGLVRTSTPDILVTLTKVREAIPSGVRVHLFGLARLRAIQQMVDLGVSSVDSASALRRAWLGGKDNYWSETGKHYRAIRIPEAGKSFRAKRMVSEGRASGDFVAKVESRCMEALRAFDKERLSLDATLSIIGEYDHLITPDRPVFLEEYRRTLEAQPWKECPCEICRKDGIEVVIFRGNNRNRRRGFHNTFVFYRLLQRVLETGDSSFLFSDEDIVDNKNQMQLFAR
jgi:hypothetical protein